jgi:hypothetical protein
MLETTPAAPVAEVGKIPLMLARNRDAFSVETIADGKPGGK